MENKTRDKILYSSFKLFLENGYEATNIRDICKDVGIKPPTLYFYHKSKEDLFFYIYDEISLNYINYIKDISSLKKGNSLEENLFALLRQKIEYYALDISKRKFILRYHLFPPEEIAIAIREKYKFYATEENKLILDMLGSCEDDDLFKSGNINECLIEYRRLESYLVYEMTMSGIKVNDSLLVKYWKIFWGDIKSSSSMLQY